LDFYISKDRFGLVVKIRRDLVEIQFLAQGGGGTIQTQPLGIDPGVIDGVGLNYVRIVGFEYVVLTS
jgi:hypothetical protein